MTFLLGIFGGHFRRPKGAQKSGTLVLQGKNTTLRGFVMNFQKFMIFLRIQFQILEMARCPRLRSHCEHQRLQLRHTFATPAQFAFYPAHTTSVLFLTWLTSSLPLVHFKIQRFHETMILFILRIFLFFCSFTFSISKNSRNPWCVPHPRFAAALQLELFWDVIRAMKRPIISLNKR